MEALWVEYSSNKLTEPKWSKMLILSAVFHVAVFSIILFAPQHMPTRSIEGVIYEVDLVEMPKVKASTPQGATKKKAVKRPSRSKKTTTARRISKPKEKKKPLVIAKRVVKRKSRKAKKPGASAAKLIDQAISKIEKKVKAQKKDPIDQAISRLESRQQGIAPKELRGENAAGGITIRIYQMEVGNWIKSNWSYPVALASPRVRKDLEAVVLLNVKNDGTILKSWFKKRSSNIIFDQSVMKAVERSDPLPPFPEGYRKTYDDVEINFNLRELEGY